MKKTKKISIRIDNDTYNKLNEINAYEKIKLSNLIRNLINNYLSDKCRTLSLSMDNVGQNKMSDFEVLK